MKSVKNILFYEGNCSSNEARHILVSMVVANSLIDYDVKTYEKVVEILYKKYGCDLYECYDHPEYLNEVFQLLPRNSHYHVVRSMNKGLGEFIHVNGIQKFLNKFKN